MGTQTALQRNRNRWQGTPEWYTPTWLVERIAAFLGPNYYDPCPASRGHVQVDGLTTDWSGRRVFCNPPYGRPLRSWIDKATTEPVDDIILLVPAYTETGWFAPLHQQTLCFLFRRLTFAKYDAQTDTTQLARAPSPSVLAYRGPRGEDFAEAFCDLGPVHRAVRLYTPRTPLTLAA